MALHRRRMVRVLVALLPIGGMVVGMLWWLQRKLISFPTHRPSHQPVR